MAKAEVKKSVLLELSDSEAFATRVFLRNFLSEKVPREACDEGSLGFAAWSVVDALESTQEKKED